MNTPTLVNTLVARLGWALVHSLWQGAVIAALTAVALRLMASASARARYAVACAALASLPLAFVGSCVLLGPAGGAAAPPVFTHPTTPRLKPSAASPLPAAEAPDLSPDAPGSQLLLARIVLCWAAGVFCVGLWQLTGWVWLCRLRLGRPVPDLQPVSRRLRAALGVSAAVRLIECARLDVPAVVGVFRPVILLPVSILTDLSPSQLEAILLHELAHVARQDYLVNLVQSATEALLFYHPATWWLSARVRDERENCCDDIAARVCGDRRRYAAALLALEERRRPRALPVTAATGGVLLDRVRRLLNANPSPQRPARSVVAAAIAIGCVVVPLVAIAQQPAPTPAPATSAANPGPLASPILPQDLEPNKPYSLGPNDLITVSLTSLAGPGVETVKTVRLGETGVVNVPGAGEVSVKGMTDVEAAAAIKSAEKKSGRDVEVVVTIDEPRGNTFSIRGAVPQAGEYMITKSDFRLSAALALTKCDLPSVAVLRVSRAARDGRPARVLTIPVAQFVAGDPSVDVVLRPGDFVTADPAAQRVLNLVLTKDSLACDGQPTDLGSLQKKLAAMPLAERRATHLHLSAQPEVTVDRLFGVVRQLDGLQRAYTLAGVTTTGIEPAGVPLSAGPAGSQLRTPAETEASHASHEGPLAPASETGEFYITGLVPRAGVYSVTGRQITLKQAVASAGGVDETRAKADQPVYLTVLRREHNVESNVLENVAYSDLLSGAQRDLYLHPYDVVYVTARPMHRAAAASQQSPAP